MPHCQADKQFTMGCSTSKNIKTSGPEPEQATLKARNSYAGFPQRQHNHSALPETLFCLQVPANVVSAGKPELVSIADTDHVQQGICRSLWKHLLYCTIALQTTFSLLAEQHTLLSSLPSCWHVQAANPDFSDIIVTACRSATTCLCRLAPPPR